ncbi:MAG TPA: protein kinase, partial [Chloroflexota bacterium]|nr:protein kinase [Chloroflexota bacterium]
MIGLPPGTMINGYRILREVGRGGMAVVYHAFQENLGRDVALKLLPGALILDPDQLIRFQHEARAVARLHHPAILVIHDVGAYHEQPYLVTEFIDGGTLATYLGTAQSLATVLRLLGPIAGALDYAHAQGLLHRDVKPTNILLRRDGRPVLADFGLAVAAEAEQRLTRTGLIMGTPEYMAPEQATQPSSALTAAVDRYALAVIAYELFTGRLPFGGATPVAVVMAHMTQPPPPPRTLNPEIPLWVEAVLLRGLAKDPNQRYPSATAFVQALAAGDHLGSAPVPSADLASTVAANEAVVSQVSSGPVAPSGMNATVAAQAPWAQGTPGPPLAAMQPTKVVQPAPKGHGRLVAAAAFGLVAGLTALVIGIYALRGGGHAAALPSATATRVPTATVADTVTTRPTDIPTAVPPPVATTAVPTATAQDTAT